MDKDSLFDPWERPKQINYQHSVSCSQFNRIRELTDCRRRNSTILNEILRGSKNLKYFEEEKNCFWNNQYYVLYIEEGINKTSNNNILKRYLWESYPILPNL